MALSLGKNPAHLMLSQFNVDLYDPTIVAADKWVRIGYVNGGLSWSREQTLVKVFDEIPRYLISEILVDDKAMLKFNLRSITATVFELLTNGLATSRTNITIAATDGDPTAPLPTAGGFDISYFGYRPAADIFARTAWNIRLLGTRKDGKIVVMKFHQCFFNFPTFDLPNNETSNDVNEIAVEMEIFPVNTLTAPNKKQLGFIGVES